MKHFLNISSSNKVLQIANWQKLGIENRLLLIAYCLLTHIRRHFHIITRNLLPIAYCLLLILSSCKQNSKDEVSSQAEDVYTCAMHPQIVRSEPGSCPICGMTLVKKENAVHEASQIDLTTLLRPTNTYVISHIPVTTIEKAPKPITIEALGRVDYDTRYTNTISAKVSGRIEKLYVKYRYQHIHQGKPVMDIYSPALVTAQQELLFLLKNDPENSTLITAAKQKLSLLGLSNDQLQQLIQSRKVKQTVTVYSNYTGHIHEAMSMEQKATNTESEMSQATLTEELPVKEGMYVEKGQAVFQVYDTDNSWAVLDLFPAEASLVKVGTRATLIPETAPDKVFQAHISFIEPFYRPGSKTITARIFFNNKQLQIPIGSQVKAKMEITSSESYWLPRNAVLSLGVNSVVLLKEDAGFKVHAVQTGIKAHDEIQITNGLTVQDSVALNAQFLMDSESFIKTVSQ